MGNENVAIESLVPLFLRVVRQHGKCVFEGSCIAIPSGPFVRAFKSVRFVKQNVFRASFVKNCIHCFDKKECICRIRCRWLRVCLFLVKQVPSWRSVCVLYSLYCVLILPDAGEAAKARCGRELVADLEFVCGDRGFYRGESHLQTSSYTSKVLYFQR